MLRIDKTPIFTKRYINNKGEEAEYTFRTVAALNNITITFQSLQLVLYSITTQGSSTALGKVAGNHVSELLQVSNEIGADNFNIYIYDNDPLGYNYSGLYHILNIQYLNGYTQFSLMNVGNTAPSYFGDKYFDPNSYSQVVYKYLNNITYEIYDNTLVGTNRVGKLLQTVYQSQEANGLSILNISEIIREYLSPSGCVAIYVVATERDFFSNTSRIESRVINFVYGYKIEENYLYNIIYNPFTMGSLLSNTFDRIYYDDDVVQPFWLNFIIQDEGYTTSSINAKLVVDIYKDDGRVQLFQQVVEMIEGMNTINICDIPNLCNMIRQQKATSIEVYITYENITKGEFTDEFTDEFFKTQTTIPPKSGSFKIKCEEYKINNRRDFYFKFNNSLGGFSTYLCKNYERSVEDEVESLRNRYDISNVTVRQTETIKLLWTQINLDLFKELLGYDIDNIFKDNGIYESRDITQLSETGEQKTFIIKAADYGFKNGDIYNDVSFTLFRPLNSGFESHGNAIIDMNITSNRVPNIIQVADPTKIKLSSNQVKNQNIILYKEKTTEARDFYINIKKATSFNGIKQYNVYVALLKNGKEVLPSKTTQIANFGEPFVKKISTKELVGLYDELWVVVFNGIAGNTQNNISEFDYVMLSTSPSYFHPTPTQIKNTRKDTIEVDISYRLTTANTLVNQFGIIYQNGLINDSYANNAIGNVTSDKFLVNVPTNTTQGIITGYVSTNFGLIKSVSQRYQYEIE